MVTTTENKTAQKQPTETSASSDPTWAAETTKAGYERKTTIGEKKFDQRAYFWTAGVGTFVLTIISAFALKDSHWKVPGKDYTFKAKYDSMTEAGAPKILEAGGFIQKTINKISQKLTQKDAIKWDLNSDAAKQNAFGVSRDAMLTTVTFFGGLVPLPFIRSMERNKAQIVRRLNEKYGTAEDVIIGEENVKDEAPQSWGSIIKGRVGAWLVVFATFAGIGAKLIPNTFGGLEKDFENIAGNVGNKIHKWPEGANKYFTANKDSESLALPENASPKQENQMYTYKRMGGLAAVDVFATAMSASLLYVISKFFAKKSGERKETQQVKINTNPIVNSHKPLVETPVVTKEIEAKADRKIMPKKKHQGTIDKREASYAAESEKEALLAELNNSNVQAGL